MLLISTLTKRWFAAGMTRGLLGTSATRFLGISGFGIVIAPELLIAGTIVYVGYRGYKWYKNTNGGKNSKAIAKINNVVGGIRNHFSPIESNRQG